MIKIKIGRKAKRFIAGVLTGAVLFSSSLGELPSVRAGTGGSKPGESGNLGVKGGRPDVHVDDKGNVIFETNDKKATNTDSTLLFLYKC